MKTALILLLTFAGYSCAEDPKLPPQGQPGQVVKKLSSVTWDLDSQKLVWVVQKGAMVNGQFVPDSEKRYEISPDEAVMAVEAERRGFDASEAQSLSHLLDILSLYCAESVEWWDQGHGTPLTPDAKPANPTGQPVQPKTDPPAGQKPVKVGQPQPQTPKSFKVPDTDMVAAVPSSK